MCSRRTFKCIAYCIANHRFTVHIKSSTKVRYLKRSNYIFNYRKETTRRGGMSNTTRGKKREMRYIYMYIYIYIFNPRTRDEKKPREKVWKPEKLKTKKKKITKYPAPKA